jgi:hypothetical protein
MSSSEKFYGPNVYKRNEDGLLTNVDYVFNEDGSVNWRAMIKPEFLYPNKGWFDLRGKPVPDSIEGLDDKQLLIMLGGIKEVARLRGFTAVYPHIQTASPGYVTASCQIEWIPNYESDGKTVSYEDVANATIDNTDSFCVKFLETIAMNRAFIRCVRNFLNIHIVGADEIDRSNNKAPAISEEASAHIVPITPSKILEKIIIEKFGAATFNEFKSGQLRSMWQEELYRNEEAKDWKSYEDIPAKEARKIIKVISAKTN